VEGREEILVRVMPDLGNWLAGGWAPAANFRQIVTLFPGSWRSVSPRAEDLRFLLDRSP
jgi:hypothetical protein